MACVIGLDIGTTSTIGILLRLPDKVLAVATRPVTLTSRHAGWAEEDPEEWWRNVCDVVPELMATSGVAPSELVGVGVAGMLPAIVLLDSDDRILRPSIQQSDARCVAEVEELKAEVDEPAFLRRTGNGVNQQIVASRLRWVERHEPAVFRRIATLFGSYDYVNWRLTGQKAIEQNWALEAGFVDLADHALADDLIGLAHVPRAAVPPKSISHKILGQVSAGAAAATGLPAGLPVVGGAADHIASALAAGLLAPGDVLLKFGGSGDIIVAAPTPVPDPRLYLDYHLVPGLFAPNGCMASAGSTLNWFARSIAGGFAEPARGQGLTVHAWLDRLAAEIPPGCDGVRALPYFLGEKTPIHDPLARGTFTGLSLNHGIPHMWRALLEGIAYAFRHHLDVMAELGYPATRFLASDGGSRSRVWMQIVSDVLQRPVQLLVNHHGSCLGAAWVAAVGTGQGVSWGDIAKVVGQGERIRPDPTRAAACDAGYAAFRDLYASLKPHFHHP